MDASDACQNLQRRIGTLFTCSEHGDYQRIRTPYLYPDGDNIDLLDPSSYCPQAYEECSNSVA